MLFRQFSMFPVRRIVEEVPQSLRRAHSKTLTKLTTEKPTTDSPSLLNIPTTASKLYIMCMIAAPILREGQDDADHPTSRWCTVESESCIGPIELEHRSPPQERSCSTDSTPRMPQHTSTSTQEQGIQETTNKTVPSWSYSADSVPQVPQRTSTKRVRSYRHHHLNQDDSHERKPAPPTSLPSRWSSSARLIVDGPPPQPLSCCQMSRGPSSSVAVNESHQEDVLDRLRITIGKLQADSDSRWSSSYRAASDTAPSKPLARH
jgi:hypothetical protein